MHVESSSSSSDDSNRVDDPPEIRTEREELVRDPYQDRIDATVRARPLNGQVPWSASFVESDQLQTELDPATLSEIAPEEYATFVTCPTEAAFDALVRAAARHALQAGKQALVDAVTRLSHPAQRTAFMRTIGAEALDLQELLGHAELLERYLDEMDGIYDLAGPAGVADAVLELVPFDLRELSVEEILSMPEAQRRQLLAALRDVVPGDGASVPDGIANLIEYFVARGVRGEEYARAKADAASRLMTMTAEHPELVALLAGGSGYWLDRVSASIADFQQAIDQLETEPPFADLGYFAENVAAALHADADFLRGSTGAAAYENAAATAEALIQQAKDQEAFEDSLMNTLGLSAAALGIAALVGGFFTGGATWVAYGVMIAGAGSTIAGAGYTGMTWRELFERQRQSGYNVEGYVRANGESPPTALDWGMAVADTLLTAADVAYLARMPQMFQSAVREHAVRRLGDLASNAGMTDRALVEEVAQRLTSFEELSSVAQLIAKLQALGGPELKTLLEATRSLDARVLENVANVLPLLAQADVDHLRTLLRFPPDGSAALLLRQIDAIAKRGGTRAGPEVALFLSHMADLDARLVAPDHYLYTVATTAGEDVRVILPTRAYDWNGALYQKLVGSDGSTVFGAPRTLDLQPAQIIGADGKPLASFDDVVVLHAHGAPWGFQGHSTEDLAHLTATALESLQEGDRPAYLVLASCSQGNRRGIFDGATNAQVFAERLVAGLTGDPVTVMASRDPGLVGGGSIVKADGTIVGRIRFVPADQQPASLATYLGDNQKPLIIAVAGGTGAGVAGYYLIELFDGR